ncbi:flagellin [Candidatus Gastranaerophilus sp. (ex Termes propinquus)]|nr:flagellin [Candidatus Gastranaerophilus sp. (ex Termes propinquus)]
MGIIINTNVDSLKVQRNLNVATTQASKAMERMTTGLKINTAADDAAGLVISKGITTQQRGSEVAIKNAQNGINLLQTAEGNLDQIQNHLLAIHDLTLQAMNGGYSVEEVKAIENEVKARADEIDRLADGAKFNEFALFEKDTTKRPADFELVLQVGSDSDKSTNTISIKDVFKESTMSALTGKGTNANGVGSQSIAFTTGTGAAEKVIDRAGAGGFEAILDKIKDGIKEISTRRGDIGAAAVRLNAAVDNLNVQNENLQAANSRIKDADIAKESSEFTNKSILQQAGASLLVQANQAPSIALSLI